MTTTLIVYWRTDEFCPSIFSCDFYSAFRMVLSLKEDKDVTKVECRDYRGDLVSLDKGWPEFCSQQLSQFRI